MLPLSVLDVSPVSSGSNATQALRNSVDLARHVEALGFRRYWVAEHHNAGSLASSAPEILIAQIASATTSMRVGAGGIMLPNHAPLKVAELFRVLGALFPERIDLGLGRAAGTDPRTAAALRRTHLAASADDFPAMMEALVAYLEDSGPPRPPFTSGIRAIPVGVPMPELFVLGSSDYGGAFAAAHGFGFAFAHHLNPVEAATTMLRYRRDFRPSKYSAAPHAILTVAAICAETAAQANELRAISDLSALRFATGMRDFPFPSADEARAHPFTDEERALTEAFRSRFWSGTADAVAGDLCELARTCQADELMIMGHTHEHALRKKSYSLLAERIRATPR